MPDRIVSLQPMTRRTTDGSIAIRPARPTDFAAIQEIEVAAGFLFASIGMQLVADDPPFSIAELEAFCRPGAAGVAADATAADERPVGYLVGEIVDGLAHLEQVSIVPSHA